MAATTEKAAAELKIQGAVEAAQRTNGNGNGAVSAEAAEAAIVSESKKAGIPAFKFNPGATIAEKKAQAKEALPDGLQSKRIKGAALATDLDDGSAPSYDLPVEGKSGAISADKAPADNLKPGAVEMGPATTGWSPRIGWPTEPAALSHKLLDRQTWAEAKIPEKFFGDWYHNAGIIIFACLMSWFIARIGFGLGWVIIVMAACSTYYRTSIRRVRRNYRDDINREMALRRLETDNESLEWINSFLVKFWPIYQPVLAATVISSVDQVLSGATPAFLDSLKLKTFTLGTKPPRVEHVKTYPKAEDDLVIMDWLFSFTPNDTDDMTSRQLKNKINPKVVLEIRIGKGMISKGMDVIVEDMAFSGLMRLKIKLQVAFPHIDRIEMCFLEKPTIDYVCKPLGGETLGFDINFIPGLESFILDQVHGNLGPMMYAPNVFPIEVAKMLGTPAEQAIGIVAVTLHGAQGLKGADGFGGSNDPYAVITLNNRAPLARTKTVNDTNSPRWNETHYIIITSFSDSLDIVVNDFNDYRKDRELGIASFPLENLEEISEHENESLEVLSNGNAQGVLNADIRFFPVLEAETLPDGKVEPPPESNTGILKFTVDQAKELDGSKSLVGQLNPYAVLLLNGKELHTTKKLKRTNNPIWDNGSKELLITDRKSTKLGVVIKDERDLAGDQVLGTYQIKLDDMLELMEKQQEWFNLAGAKTGRAKITAQWKPVALSGVLAGTGGYQTPIGVMRIHFQKATNLRNFETVGKSDAYARVLVSGIEKARTVTFLNNLNPEWDEVLYVPIHSARERLQLEAMDAENMGKDRSLGLIDVHASEYVKQAEDGSYLPHPDKVLREEGLRLHGKGMPKGVLTYTVSFFPALNVADPEDEETEKERLKAEAEKEAKEAAAAKEVKDAKKGDKSSEDSAAPKKAAKLVPPVVRLSPEELLKYQSGFVVFKLMEAEMPKTDSRLEVFVDDMAFPSYISSTAKTRSYKYEEIGDCFIRELDFSRLTIKACERGEKSDDENDKALSRLAGNTLDTLKQCLNNPTVLKLKGDDGKMSSVKVSLKFIPVLMDLDASESINNMGNLRVDVLDGHDLPAADKNGKSDPYAKFDLNGVEVFKTKTIKKTLNPTWNEFFEVVIKSRTAAKFLLNVYDYDFADKPDFLGGAVIPLADLEPFQAQELTLPLDGQSGSVRLRFVFRPDYITRSRVGTATFAGTPGKLVTGVAGAPIKGGAAVVGVVGSGVGKGASFLKRGFRSSKKEEDLSSAGATSSSSFASPSASAAVPVAAAGAAVGAAAAGAGAATNGFDSEPLGDAPGAAIGSAVTPSHTRTRSMGASSIHTTAGSPSGGIAGAGTAVFTVVSATGFPPSSDVYVAINQVGSKSRVIGKTKHHKSPSGNLKFDETFKAAITPDAQFQVQAREQHRFGSDDNLGEALYVVDDSGTGSDKELKVGPGTVVVRSSFTPNEPSGTDSPKSTFRRSFLSKREGAPRPSFSREGTPA